ncbi:MAG: hypothetical protein WCK78_19615 [Paludibacter sp.]
MLFYNSNIRRKTTFKIPVIFGEENVTKKELYSYSIFTKELEVKEIVFELKQVFVFKYNPTTLFLDSLEIYNNKNERIRRYYFDLITNESNSLKFKESFFERDKNVCIGYLEKQADFHELSFHRVDSFLGHRKVVKLLENEYGDYIREEHYEWKKDILEYVLENMYEYYESSLDKLSSTILENGWN